MTDIGHAWQHVEIEYLISGRRVRTMQGIVVVDVDNWRLPGGGYVEFVIFHRDPGGRTQSQFRRIPHGDVRRITPLAPPDPEMIEQALVKKNNADQKVLGLFRNLGRELEALSDDDAYRHVVNIWDPQVKRETVECILRIAEVVAKLEEQITNIEAGIALGESPTELLKKRILQHP